jgi:hypothetical protein
MSSEVREGGKGIKSFRLRFLRVSSRDTFRRVDADGKGGYFVASQK